MIARNIQTRKFFRLNFLTNGYLKVQLKKIRRLERIETAVHRSKLLNLFY